MKTDRRASRFDRFLRRRRAAEERASLRERELEAIQTVSDALARAGDAESVARIVLDEIAALFSVEFVGLVLVDDELSEGRGLLARRDGVDFDPWRDIRFDLRNEPSGVASAAFEAAPVTIYDTDTSPLVNKAVARRVGARSAAFVPLVAGERVIAVLAVATTHEHRAFSPEELGPLRTVAAEAALALERARSASALQEALERERLLSSIARKVRSELDLDSVIRVAVEEAGTALGAARCFVRLGSEGEELRIAAEWAADGVELVQAEDAGMLPASNLAVETGKTVAWADVPEDLEAEAREALLGLGTRSVLATPIAAFDRTIGVLAVHRRGTGIVGRARGRVHRVRRQRARPRHPHRQAAPRERGAPPAAVRAPCVRAGGDERAPPRNRPPAPRRPGQRPARGRRRRLLPHAPDGRMLRCAAVHGIDQSLIGYEFLAAEGLAGRAIAEGTAAVEQAYERISNPVPNPAYGDFVAAMVAPMTWAGETRGVIGIGTRDRRRTFTDADADVLTTFATLARWRCGTPRASRSVSGRLASRVGLTDREPARRARIPVVDARSRRARGDRGVRRRRCGRADAGARGLPRRRRSQPARDAARGVRRRATRRSGGARARGFGGRDVASTALASDERFGESFRDAAGAASLLAIPLTLPRLERRALALVLFRERRVFTDDDLDLARQLAERSNAALIHFTASQNSVEPNASL